MMHPLSIAWAGFLIDSGDYLKLKPIYVKPGRYCEMPRLQRTLGKCCGSAGKKKRRDPHGNWESRWKARTKYCAKPCSDMVSYLEPGLCAEAILAVIFTSYSKCLHRCCSQGPKPGRYSDLSGPGRQASRNDRMGPEGQNITG
jgi:hypothetical protein